MLLGVNGFIKIQDSSRKEQSLFMKNMNILPFHFMLSAGGFPVRLV